MTHGLGWSDIQRKKRARRRRITLLVVAVLVVIGTLLWWKFAPAYVYASTFDALPIKTHLAQVARGVCCVVVGGGVVATAAVEVKQ